MVTLASAASNERHPLFPPLVGFTVFLRAVRALAGNGGALEAALAGFSNDDRSKARRALLALELVATDGTVDEVTVRRLADEEQRPAALRALLEQHYRPELDAIADGIDSRALGDLLIAPGRSSPSAAEKARQFLKRALAEAEFNLPQIRRSRPPSGVRSRPSRTRRPAAKRTATSQDDAWLTAQYQRFLANLQVGHDRTVAEGRRDAELEARIERVLTVLSGPPSSDEPRP